MLTSEDFFVFGLVFVASPLLIFVFEAILGMGIPSRAYFSSLVGTIGVLFLVASILR